MNQKWFLAVADRLSDPVLLLAPKGTVLACNYACRRAIGGDLLGKSLPEMTAEEEAFRRYLGLASRSGSPLPGALSFAGTQDRWRCDAGVAVTRDGASVVLHLRPSSETSRRFAALNHQISKLQAEIRRREELEQEREQLLLQERESRLATEQANRFKDELLASISHELRTPLHAITGWLALIKNAPHDRDRFMHGLDVIERNVKAQTQLTEDLVDTSLVITGRMKLQLQPVELEQVIRQAVESAAPAAASKQQRLEVIANVGNCVVNGDPDRLLQVVWNLLSNATKYTPKGGKIQVVLRRINSHAEILVSDTGEGIAPDVLPYVFDRFRRADAGSTRRHGGLGLGLSIVRHLVELHGGVVMADSPGLGQGTTVTVNLPMPLFSGRRAAHTPPDPQPAAAKALQGVSVLIVEDHADSRELLAHILGEHGAQITAVEGAREAYQLFEHQEIEVVVSDIEMPEEDGFTLMRKLRALERTLDRPSVPAIAISAHSIGDARLHALRAGYQAFMSKPLKPAELVAMVESLFHNQARAK